MIFAGRWGLTKGEPPTAGPREAVFHPEFREDLRYWTDVEQKIALRVWDLVEAIMRNPEDGVGKPERLKYLGPGIWSRRITEEHRLVYKVSHDRIDVVQARYHY